jgi:2-oxoisovalerate dehydrogenase E1 component
MTLAQSINATLTDLMDAQPSSLLFGQDVALKGGVYGVTRGLRKRFGGFRVFDTLLDEQTILGTALGSALAGFVPIPEIQYLAYVHNAEDQLRGEAASLRFFSNGQYQNGMVVRIAGLAYQRGFGGHFHNDNAVAVLRDIPGLVIAAPSHPAEAPGLLRTCFSLAQQDGRVCVFLEPIAKYHQRDLLDEGDGVWTAEYVPPDHPQAFIDLGVVGRHGDGRDVLLVTFGNGVHLSMRAAIELAGRGVNATVLDLRWLAPLPEDALTKVARDFGSVLVVDETRRSGGVSEAIITALVEAGYHGNLARVASADSFIPLGPAADAVLLSEDDIVAATLGLLT